MSPEVARGLWLSRLNKGNSLTDGKVALHLGNSSAMRSNDFPQVEPHNAEGRTHSGGSGIHSPAPRPSAPRPPWDRPVAPEDMLDSEQVAAWLNLHVETVRKLARDGFLPVVKLGTSAWRLHVRTAVNQLNDPKR